MTLKVLRLAFALEFLVALIAIFTAWSEIGGQAALDLMPWGWKLGLSVALAAATVQYTVALSDQNDFWSLRSARWLSFILIVGLVMGLVTYYYVLQEDTMDSDEGNTSTSALTLVTPGHLAS
jgi:hypothetical protein